jgi:pimeloyl-ACP methyl ester carboxylesterase
MKQVVVLHGWSDNSESFKPLISFLKKNGYKVTPLFLGDYTSLRDDVKIEDVARRMEDVVNEKMARPRGARDKLDKRFDLIVHSTGGLLARLWISEYYKDRDCPVRNLLMLAPANFGSVLAHTGRSMLGRIFKGFKTGFEVGEEMLHSLELGSSFQWDLAQRDLFVSAHGDSKAHYTPETTRPFIVTGTHPYEQLSRKLVNENGSDGTVRVAAANLNAQGTTIDFTTSLSDPEVTGWRRRGGANLKFPLAVLADRDHGNVIKPDKDGHSNDPGYHAKLGELILDALSTNTAKQYKDKVESWKAVSMDTRTFAGSSAAAVKHRRETFGRSAPDAEYFHEHYQLVIHAVDQFGAPVPDFFVEFFPKPDQLHRWSEFRKPAYYFHKEVLEDVHVNRRDSSRICFFVDRYDLMRTDGGFYSMIREDAEKSLAMTVTASDPGSNVSYFDRRAAKPRGIVKLHGQVKADRWLKRHSTHFVKLIVPRVGDKKLFSLKRA